MRPASFALALAEPISAALRKHCTARLLLRVTPRLRAWQIMLATSCATVKLKK
jgi:hypothetical protein